MNGRRIEERGGLLFEIWPNGPPRPRLLLPAVIRVGSITLYLHFLRLRMTNTASRKIAETGRKIKLLRGGSLAYGMYDRAASQKCDNSKKVLEKGGVEVGRFSISAFFR